MNQPRKREGVPDAEGTILDLYLHEAGREGPALASFAA